MCYTLDDTKPDVVVGIAIVVVRREHPSVRTIVRIATADKPRVVRVHKVRVI